MRLDRHGVEFTNRFVSESRAAQNVIYKSKLLISRKQLCSAALDNEEHPVSRVL